jgi:hypothetical protein
MLPSDVDGGTMKVKVKSEVGIRGNDDEKQYKVVYYRDKKAIREWLTLSAIEIIQGGPSDHSC